MLALLLNLGSSLAPAVVVPACAAPAPCAGSIVRDAPAAGAREAPPRPAARRQRRVTVDVGQIFAGGEPPAAARAAERLALNLFPDVCVLALRDRATDLGRGRVQWEGHVPGASPGSVTLVVDGTLVVGTVRLDRDVYAIGYLGDGIHAVTDVDPSKFPRD